MESLPHHYSVVVNAKPDNHLQVSADHLPTLDVDAPSQFGGRAINGRRRSYYWPRRRIALFYHFERLPLSRSWNGEAIRCTTDGVLDKVERTMQFTEIVTKVALTIDSEASRQKAETLLAKAEKICIVSNSLTAQKRLEIELIVEQ